MNFSSCQRAGIGGSLDLDLQLDLIACWHLLEDRSVFMTISKLKRQQTDTELLDECTQIMGTNSFLSLVTLADVHPGSWGTTREQTFSLIHVSVKFI